MGMAYPHSDYNEINEIKRGKHIDGFKVGDVIRMPHYNTAGGSEGRWRAWKITGCYLGATHQEGTYEMVPVDVKENEPIQVPCIILHTHPAIERV